MKKALLLLCALLLVGSGSLQAKVSSSDTNLSVIAAGKRLYGQTFAGYPVRMLEVNSSGVIELDADGVGSVVGGALTAPKIVLDSVQTFTNSDATPNVGSYSYFKTGTANVTITDFDGTGIEDGQIIVVISKGATTYDVTSSGIKGGTTDIVTAAGDVTTFLYDGTDWIVIARMDMSDDLN